MIKEKYYETDEQLVIMQVDNIISTSNQTASLSRINHMDQRGF